MKKILLSLSLIGSLFASEANLEISNHTIAINAQLDIPQNENFAIRGNYLINDKENRENFYSFGFQAQGENALDNYNSKLAIFIDVAHTKNNTAIPIGVSLFNNHFGNLNYPLFAKLELSYAPAILSFDDADKFYQIKAELGVKPIENAKAFIGYKNIHFDETYLSTGYMGIGFVF